MELITSIWSITNSNPVKLGDYSNAEIEYLCKYGVKVVQFDGIFDNIILIEY